MEILMQSNEVFNAIEEEVPENETATFKRKNIKCMNLITEHLDDSLLVFVRGEKFARNVWTSLIATYECTYRRCGPNVCSGCTC